LIIYFRNSTFVLCGKLENSNMSLLRIYQYHHIFLYMHAACKLTRCADTWWVPPHLSFGCSCNVSKHNFNKSASGTLIFVFIILVFSRICMLSMFFQLEFVKSTCIRSHTLMWASRSAPSHLVVILLIFNSALCYSASCYWMLACIPTMW